MTDTPALTAEDRAVALFVEISRIGRIVRAGGPVEAQVVAAIASAIREAEDEARMGMLEAVVATFRERHFLDRVFPHEIMGLIGKASADYLDTLKSQKETP